MIVAFVVLAVLMLVGAIATITLKNAVHASLSLVATLLTLAMMYYTLDAQFLASTQVIVYAGAIMVLFLFVIMLLNATKPDTSEDPLPWLPPLAIAGGLVLAAVLSLAAFRFVPPQSLETASATLKGGAPAALGEVLFTKFLLPFEAVSILLLVAIVGAVSLVRRAPSTVPESEETTVVAQIQAPSLDKSSGKANKSPAKRSVN
jgi:NADH-quinone oxidoreductase subunit J